jgi:hypothetical protein
MEKVFIFRPCKTGAAFEAILKKNVKLDLEKISKTLEENGYKILALTDYILMIRGDYELSIFPSGKVLIKDINDATLAEMIIEKIYKILGLVG